MPESEVVLIAHGNGVHRMPNGHGIGAGWVATLPTASIRYAGQILSKTDGTTHLCKPDGLGGWVWVELGTSAGGSFVETADLSWFNVKTYGAVGDDSTDDTTAFTDAIADVVAGGGVLYVPAGRYKITNDLPITLAVDNHHIEVMGDGKYQSILRFTGASVGGGIAFSSTLATDFLHPVFHIHDLGIITSKKNAGTALSIAWDDAQSADETFRVENLMIGKDITRVSDSGADFGYWGKGIDVSEGRNGEIRNCYIQGENTIATVSSHGIHLQGESTACVITSNQITGFTYGLLSGDTTEGVYAAFNDFLYGDTGIHINCTGGEPQMTIIGNSFNTKVYGLRLTNAMASVVSGNLFYSWDNGADVDWTAIRVDGSDTRQLNITDNAINREPTTTGVTTIGVDLANGTDINVTNNHLFAYGTHVLTTGVKVGASVAGARIRNNQVTNVTTNVSDVGTNTQIEYWDDSGPKFAGAANQFCYVSGSAAAFLQLEDTGGGANAKYTAMVSDGGGWDVRQLNDDGSLKAMPLAITSANVVTASSLSGVGTRMVTAGASGDLSTAAIPGGGAGITVEDAQDAVGTILVDSASIDLTYSDATPSITAAAIFGTTATTVAQGSHVHTNDHVPVTVVDTTTIDLTLTGQQISAAAITGTTSTTVAAGNHTHAPDHAAVTVVDSASIDLTLAGQQITAAAIFGTTATTVAQGSHVHTNDHVPVTVLDTASIDLTLTGQQVSGVVLPGGISHTAITAIGTNTHAQIDTHLAAANPHSGSQPLDTDLTTLATNITAFGHSLVDDADALSARATLGVGTANSPQFNAIDLGHASDTTISRVSAGVVAVEGTNVSLAGHTHSYLPLSGGTTTGKITFGMGAGNVALDASTNDNYVEARVIRNSLWPGDKLLWLGYGAGATGAVGLYANTTEGLMVNSTSVVVNEGALDRDTRIEGTADQNLVFADASTNRVGIGTATPATKLDVVGGGAFSGDVTVPTEVYGVGWSGSLEVPTKDALYGKIELIASGTGITQAAADLRYLQLTGGTMSGAVSGITTLGTTGANTLANLAGTGSRVVEASSAGLLSASAPLGMVLLETLSPSSAATASSSAIFTSAYANYLIVARLAMSTAATGLLWRLRAAGADIALANYYTADFTTNSGATTAPIGGVAATSGTLIAAAAGGITWTDIACTLLVSGPQVVDETLIAGTLAGRSSTPALNTYLTGGFYNATTSADAFTILPAAGTITGTVKIYGLR